MRQTPSVTHGLHRTMLFSFKMFEHFAVIFLELVSISVLLSSENIRIMIFSYFKVDKNYFVYKDICYLSDCLLCTWNKCIFCFWLGCPIKAKWTQLVDSVVQIFYISLTFCLLVLPIRSVGISNCNYELVYFPFLSIFASCAFFLLYFFLKFCWRIFD